MQSIVFSEICVYFYENPYQANYLSNPGERGSLKDHPFPNCMIQLILYDLLLDTHKIVGRLRYFGFDGTIWLGDSLDAG